MLKFKNPTLAISFATFIFVIAPGIPVQAEEVIIEDEFATIPDYRVFGEPPSPGDEEAALDTMQRFGMAWGTQDVDGAVATYTDDAEWVNAFADVYRGHEEIRGQFTQLFERFESGPDQDGEDGAPDAEEPMMKRGIISLRFIGEKAAVVHSYTESSWGRNRDGDGPRRVHITFVLEKQDDGEWLIAHQMIMDARR